MKKFSSLIAILLLCTVSLFAQAPEKFTYQAVVRNASNSLVANAQVGVRISILQGSTSGNTVYVEVHSATTNANGLVTVNIGDGTVQQGTFSEIDWANGPFFLKTETDPNGGTHYNVTSTQQLLSVPYAMYAKEAGNVPTIPTNVSSFTNDAGYITAQEIPTIPTVPTNVSAFNNDAGYITSAAIPTIPTVPTNVSAFTNDAGYITLAQVPTQVNADWNATSGAAQILNKPTLFSGNYNDLTNKPTLFSGNYNDLSNKPTLFDGNYNSLTNRPNLTAVAISGSYNDLINKPAIPTAVGELTNNVGYITLAQVPAQVNADWNATTGAAQILNKPTLFSGNYNDLSNKPALFSGNYNDLSNKPTIPTVPTNVSAFTNDAGYITSTAIPAIPTVPTNVSAFTNDAGYLTSYTETDPQFNAWDKDYNDLINKPVLFDGNYNSLTNKPNIPTVPTNVSAFTNDAGYVTAAEVQHVAGVPTVVSAFQNDAGYITAAQVPAQVNADWNATTGAAQILNKPTLFSGNYNDLTNKPTIPTVPTNVSAFNNDAGYITSAAIPAIPTVPTNVSAFTNDVGYLTSYTEQQVLSLSNDTIFLTGGSFVKLPEGFSGSWNDLTDKPANITVPDSVSAFVNDAGYITQGQLNALLSGFNSLIDSLSNEIYTLRMMMDTTLYTVTVVANNDSMGSVFGSGSFRWGATDTLIAVPDSGYRIKYWVSNLGDTLTSSTIVITVKQNVVWTACFDLQELPQWENYSSDTWHNMYTTLSATKGAILKTSKGEFQNVWNLEDTSQYTDSIMSSNIDYYFPMSWSKKYDSNIEIKIPQGMNFDLYEYDSMAGRWVVHNVLFTANGNNIYRYAFTGTVKAIYGIKLINQ